VSVPGILGLHRALSECFDIRQLAQASAAFSAQHLEDDPAAISARMLPLLCDQLSLATNQVTHASAHRWRYARVTVPFGRPFLKLTVSLYAGGDRCIGPRVEDEWISGDAIAQDICRPFHDR
jgi:hypothetical protein